MMEFQKAIDSLVNFLGESSDGRYFVVGHQKQMKNSIALRGQKMVQVYHAGGSFDRNTSGMNSETTYEAIATVRLTVSEAAKVDLSVLNNPSSTPQERIDALGAMQEAEHYANRSMDDLFSYMFALIMGGDGEHFGDDTKPYYIADRWGHDFKKEPALKEGSLVVINGYYDIGFSVREIPEGHIPVDGNIVSGEIDFQDGNGDELHIETGA